jgi:hypothetical protein
MKKRKINWNKQLFRASSFGNLMAGTKGISQKQLDTIAELEAKKTFIKPLGKLDTKELDKLSALDNPNEKQILRRAELEKKRDTPKGLTPKQEAYLNDLIKLRDKPLELSDGAKTYLKKLYREIKWNRYEPLDNKYLDKGNDLEDDAIAMLSRHHKRKKGEEYKNNKDRRNNSYFTGECDIIEGFDTKCSWSLKSFPQPDDPLPAIYYYQNMVYMDLYGKKEWTTSYCLLDMTMTSMADLLYREEFKPKWKGDNIPDWRKMELINLNVYTEEGLMKMIKKFNITFKDDEKAVDIFNAFVPIPEDKRIVEKTVYMDKKELKLMKEIVKLARKELIRLDNL